MARYYGVIMSKTTFKPGNMLYPVPAVMVSTMGTDGKPNILTIAWAGTVNSDPPMVSISVRKNRYSYKALEETGEFVVNLTTKELVRATDFCGVKSGADVDKFKECGLTPFKSAKIKAPGIAESPVNIECKVISKTDLGTHTMFVAEVVNVTVDDKYMDEKGKFDLAMSEPIAYSHGEYYSLGEKLGTFGYSVRKK